MAPKMDLGPQVAALEAECRNLGARISGNESLIRDGLRDAQARDERHEELDQGRFRIADDKLDELTRIVTGDNASKDDVEKLQRRTDKRMAAVLRRVNGLSNEIHTLQRTIWEHKPWFRAFGKVPELVLGLLFGALVTAVTAWILSRH